MGIQNNFNNGIKPTALEELEELEKQQTVETKKEAVKFAMWGFIILAAFICFMLWCFESAEKAYNTEHVYGKYRCTRCGGYETHGFNTFWYNSGMLCTGDKEYCLTHAAYSIFSCDHCGNNFKITRAQWQNK